MDIYRDRLAVIRRKLKQITLQKYLLKYALRRRERRGYFRAEFMKKVEADPGLTRRVGQIQRVTRSFLARRRLMNR